VDAQIDTRRTTERAAKTKMIFNLTFYPLAGLAIRHYIDFVLTSGHFICFISCDVVLFSRLHDIVFVNGEVYGVCRHIASLGCMYKSRMYIGFASVAHATRGRFGLFVMF